ncbi:MAG TPA: PilZ domain-containing protein [Methylomirabilota bacterium]|nr:PilZ domain-containing protein [Methylomirabilota bacterium]
MSGHDRRAFPRAAAAWPATVESSEGRVLSGEVVNVSLSGMKVRSASAAAVGSIVTVRVTLPGAAGRLEMVGTVVRRDAESIGVAFLKLSDSPAGRVTPFVSRGDTRRRFPRVPVALPIRVEGGSEGTAQGHTVDLSASGGRVTTDTPLVEGDVVVLELPERADLEQLRLPALVWESYVGGAVLVFANLAPKEFARLQEYLACCQARGSRSSSV